MISSLKTSSKRKNVIFISPDINIPETLQKDIIIYDFPLPTLEEIKKRIKRMISVNKGVDTATLTEEEIDKLCKAALGLTMQEAENAFALAMVNDGKLTIDDIDIILGLREPDSVQEVEEELPMETVAEVIKE